MQKITTFLWFDNQAEEAARFYVSLFKDSKVLEVTRSGASGPGEPGSALTVSFQLAGQEFIALNGGPVFKFNEAISLSVSCDDQDEVDRLWAALTNGGEEQPCAWLKDRYGLSWQIVPKDLPNYLYSADPAKSGRAMQAMLKMKKIDMAEIKRAYEGN